MAEVTDIGWAVDQMRGGRCVRRKDWTPQSMYLYLVRGQASECWGETTVEPYVVMHTARGTRQPGWECRQADLLATDWEVLE